MILKVQLNQIVVFQVVLHILLSPCQVVALLKASHENSAAFSLKELAFNSKRTEIRVVI